MIALPKTNTAPKNGWLEDEISYWEGVFSGDIFIYIYIYMLVLGRVCFFFSFFVALIPVLMTRLSLMFRMLVGASFFPKFTKLHCTPTFFFEILKIN